MCVEMHSSKHVFFFKCKKMFVEMHSANTFFVQMNKNVKVNKRCNFALFALYKKKRAYVCESTGPRYNRCRYQGKGDGAI